MEEMDLSLSPASSIADDADGQPSPRKKARVQFDEDVEMREIPYNNKVQNGSHGTTDKSAAVVREEVRRAIQRHVSGGDSEAYDRVKE